ncbi:MAG: YedE-related selenium metabolism membrane protein [Deltaproteobacteria bacterium]|jgi:YedE family putative selenium metabolism protein|nr:YedE-related selenium metabolism membrane protein [Deltaproteobacteria bacterium]
MSFFANWKGALLAGTAIGVGAVILQKLGNPGNMGLCVACFGRDVSGALGLHQAAAVQYARPEIFGLIIGAFIAAIFSGEFKPRIGANPLIKFFLGAFVGIGALIFLGCPWRAFLRLAGGDLNAIFGLLGLITGIAIGALFIKKGFSLGVSKSAGKTLGLVFVIFALAILVLRIAYPPLEGQPKNEFLFYSLTGPGSQRAPLLASLGIALVVGFLGQRSRFCSVGAVSNFILFRQSHLLIGILGFFGAAFVFNLILGQFHAGFANQPIAHTLSFWNFFGLLVVGLGSALAGGCPGRQLFLAGEGDGDAAIFSLGLLGGLAMAHNWSLASSAAGLGPHGAGAGIISLIIIGCIALAGRQKIAD